MEILKNISLDFLSFFVNWRFPKTNTFVLVNQPPGNSGGVSIAGGGSGVVAVGITLAVAVSVAVSVFFWVLVLLSAHAERFNGFPYARFLKGKM